MKTKTAPTTGNAKKRPAAIEITASVFRLAKQYNRDPHDLAEELLRAGCRALDDATAEDTDCVSDFGKSSILLMAMSHSWDLLHGLTITGVIEAMEVREIKRCEQEAHDCEQTFQEVVRERMLSNASLGELA